MSKSRNLLIASALASVLAGPALAQTLGLGRVALPEEIAAWDVAVLPDGTGLKPGSGDVATGDEVFAEKCASCHGDFAEGLDSWPVLAGGMNTLTDPRPVKTIGSYWPYLSTVFDYVHRSMPFGAAQTISVDETYAIAAFLLYSNGLVEDDFVLSHENFTEIRMPNVDGFYPDDRPETEYVRFRGEPCMTDCAPGAPEVTKRAVLLNVTPQDPDGKPAGTLPDIRASAAATPAAAPAAEPAPAPATAADPAPAATPAVAAADPKLIEAGQKVFRQCAACHKVGEGAKNGTGPALNGIVGATVGTVAGFKYSKPMADAGAGGMVWDEANLAGYLADPKGFMPKNKMAFNGLKKDDDIKAVIAFLAATGH
ncbi:MAG: c-type cytochrome [Gemmobacter sp.]|nr:c-type cytochrome [Gemmobacter sp.]